MKKIFTKKNLPIILIVLSLILVVVYLIINQIRKGGNAPKTTNDPDGINVDSVDYQNGQGKVTIVYGGLSKQFDINQIESDSGLKALGNGYDYYIKTEYNTDYSGQTEKTTVISLVKDSEEIARTIVDWILEVHVNV